MSIQLVQSRVPTQGHVSDTQGYCLIIINLMKQKEKRKWKAFCMGFTLYVPF